MHAGLPDKTITINEMAISPFSSRSPASTQLNPARLTAVATAKLPRWGLLGICLIYILAGLITREPWKSEDVVGLAQMYAAWQGGWRQWLTPEVAGIAMAQEGPLITWVGALCMIVFEPLVGHILAGRIPNLIWFGIASTSLWYGSYLLGRRQEAQPLALPFGGQPGARDYGRMLADAALLLLLGTLGVLWRSHETSAEPAALAFGALAFYSFTRMLENPRSGAVTLGIALGGAFLARGLPAVAPILVTMLVLLVASRALRPARPWMLMLSLPLGAALSLAWWVPASQLNPYWMAGWWNWHLSVFGLLNAEGVSATLRNLPWFLWPTGPLALLAIWRWRDHFRATHMQLPLASLLGAAVMLLLTRQPVDAEFLAFVIPSAVLAAFALPTLRRGLINALDWFAVMAFSFALAVVWLGWVAMMTGVPPKIARNIARQTPGYDAEFSILAVTIALVSTLVWGALVLWRFRSRPTGLWRGTVMSAGGVLVVWLLLMSLWLPSINYSKSYRLVSNGLAATLAGIRADNGGKLACVRSAGLGMPQRASFAVFDGLRFERSADCPMLLLQGNASMLWQAVRKGEYAGAQILWEGGRASDSRRGPEEREYFMLLRTSARDGS